CAVFEDSIDFFRQTPPLLQLSIAQGGVFDLDQQGATEFPFAAQEFIVRIDFMYDVGFPYNPLRSDHLLNLITDGKVIFEEQGEVFAKMNTAKFLRFHDLRAKAAAYVFIGDIVDN